MNSTIIVHIFFFTFTKKKKKKKIKKKKKKSEIHFHVSFVVQSLDNCCAGIVIFFFVLCLRNKSIKKWVLIHVSCTINVHILYNNITLTWKWFCFCCAENIYYSSSSLFFLLWKSLILRQHCRWTKGVHLLCMKRYS